MSSEYRAISPLAKARPTQAKTQVERSDESTVLIAPYEHPPCLVNDSPDDPFVSSSTATRSSIDTLAARHQEDERAQPEATAGAAESGETHAFLPNASPAGNRIVNYTQKGYTSLLATWWLEIVSLLLAMAALIAIAVTMSEYNKKEQPAWKYTVNLNTLIAILSTLLRACMVAVAEEGKIKLELNEHVD
jgi:hypothetical protein